MNRVLFEISYIGSLSGCFHIIFFFCIFISLYLGMRRAAKEDNGVWNRKIVRIDMKVVIVIVVIYTITLVKGYIDIVVSYKTGHYIEIEGVVEDYHFVPGEKKGYNEYIFIDGVVFRCPTSLWGYYPTNRNNKVVVGKGQHLKIRYVRIGSENTIVYIEQIIPEEEGK